jgi:pimeloyl-[acyl-carrier protein] methyl ester esterase
VPGPSCCPRSRASSACTPAAAVCGWSLGGLLAQRLAQRHPGKVRQLVLVASTPCFVERADWPHAMAGAALEAFASGLHANREATLANFVRLNALHGAHGREAIRAFTTRLLERGTPPEEALLASLGWLRDTDLRPQAALLQARTLVIHGTRDALAPVAAGHWLATHIRDATLLELSDAAHLPFFTHRAPVLEALGAFVG